MKYLIAILICFLSVVSCASIHVATHSTPHVSHHSTPHHTTHTTPHHYSHPKPSVPLHSRPKNYNSTHKYNRTGIDESYVLTYGNRFYYPIFNNHTSQNDTIWGNSPKEVVDNVNTAINEEDDSVLFILVMLGLFMIFALIMFKYKVFGK